MSVWTRENCVLTELGNLALTEIAAKGGTMSFDSVWTCDTRVNANDLYKLTDLPNKNQRMILTKYTQVSSGYTINVQVTNEDLESDYFIEMVGIYMKLNGFNEGNPFLYMVLLADEDTADKMTTISRSTYKYSIYLYHTNKAVLNISLNAQDFVATDTFENAVKETMRKTLSIFYATDYNMAEFIGSEIFLTTEHPNDYPFTVDGNRATQAPLLLIQNYSGSFIQEDEPGIYIDNQGPFKLLPGDKSFDYEVPVTFNNENLLCSVIGNTIYVYNCFPKNNYMPVVKTLYSNFNAIPAEVGVYSLSGNSTNAPTTLSSDDVWSCSVFEVGETLICVALNNSNNLIYQRSTPNHSWSSATSWKSIGGSGVQTATAVFVNSSNSASTSGSYMRITRDETSNALKAGDVLMCTLSSLSTLTGSTTVTVRYVDSSSSVTKYIYNVDNSTKTPCCQIPKYFLLEYDGTNFHMLTPLNVKTTLSTTDPTSSDGKYGDIWYTY